MSSPSKPQTQKARRQTIQHFFTQGHVGLYRLTGGAIGGKMGERSLLILTTIGRKSGQKRDTPLQFLADGTQYVIIASNGGATKHPTWWLNLQSNPQAEIQIGKQVISVTAKQADVDESKRLWTIIGEKYQNFVGYQKKTTREIPIVILTPDA